MKKAAIILCSALLACCSSKSDHEADRPAGINDPDAVNLSLSQKSKQIEDCIFGYNTQSIKGPGWERGDFISKITELNPGNFRYPGGTVGNFWDWKTGYYNDIGKSVNVIAPSASGPLPYKLDHVKMVYENTGAIPVYLINMLTSTYEDQLEMLKYAESIGLPVKFIEMGNEYYLDDHPENYNYLTVFPQITDYTDMCREWTEGFRKEFPDAKIGLIGVNSPSSWKKVRAHDWNDTVMDNMDGIQCDAMTIHIYTKNNLDSPAPYDMIGQTLASVAESKVLDPSIDPEYGLWITEYNYEGASNPFPGQWVHGLAATIMSANLIVMDRVEMICFFNLTAGKTASAIFDSDVDINGTTAPACSLSATGEGLKMLSRAQRGAESVRTVKFSENPSVKTQKHGEINTLYGYMFGGETPKLLVINIGKDARTVNTGNIGFNPTSFEQISGSSLETAVAGPSSLSRLSRNIGENGQVMLRPYSITVIQ